VRQLGRLGRADDGRFFTVGRKKQLAREKYARLAPSLKENQQAIVSK
jgi:hypothetical protein